MQLARELGLTFAIFLVIGNIVGTGIFTASGLIAGEIGTSPWLILIWLLGGMMALIGALCYGLLARHIPKTGGEYAFLFPHYGPLPAFLSGWASLLIGFSAPVAAAALAIAYYLSPFISLDPDQYPLIFKLSAASVLLLVTLLISMHLKLGAWIHSGVTVLNLALLAVFVAAVFETVAAGEHLTPLFEAGLEAVDLPSLGSAVLLVMFTYSGWNAAVYLAEEIRDPERNIPRALISGTLLVTALYTLVNLTYFSAVPVERLSGQVAVAEIVSNSVFGPAGRLVVSSLIIVSILTSLTAMSIAGPRVYFAMSRDGLLPRGLSRVDPRRKLPLRAIWFQSGMALLLIMAGSFYQILLYAGSVLLFFAALTVSVLFRIRAGGGLGGFLAYRLLPGFFIANSVVVLVAAAWSHPFEALAGLLTVLSGLPIYLIYRPRSSRA